MRRDKRLYAAALFTLAGCTAAVAQLADVPNYGNEAGCDYLATGNIEDDTMKFLTDREIGGYGGGCGIALSGYDLGDTMLIQGICTQEGEEGLTAQSFIVPPPYGDGQIKIYREDGELWGELEPCS